MKILSIILKIAALFILLLAPRVIVWTLSILKKILKILINTLNYLIESIVEEFNNDSHGRIKSKEDEG